MLRAVPGSKPLDLRQARKFLMSSGVICRASDLGAAYSAKSWRMDSYFLWVSGLRKVLISLRKISTALTVDHLEQAYHIATHTLANSKQSG